MPIISGKTIQEEVDVKIINSLIQICVGAVIVILMVSCGSKVPLPTEKERAEARKKIPCVIVLPVETGVNIDPGVTYEDAAVVEAGAQFMDGVIAEELAVHENIRVLSKRQLTSLMPEDANTRLGLIKAVGTELKCGAVMIVSLSEYRQRVGGSFGADVPASAAFSMRLINANDGSVIWSGQFKEAQQSLMSDIMSFGKAQSRGFKWITVEELVRQGLSEKIKECPYL